MAEWLRTGLQIRLRRFDSGSGLQGSKWFAALAQLVEHIIRNDGVTCSSHVSGTTFHSSCQSNTAMRLAGNAIAIAVHCVSVAWFTRIYRR